MSVPVECRPLNAADMPLVTDLAHRIWPHAYVGILTAEQIDNLLTRIYCLENLCEELAQGHRFWAAYAEDEVLGFASGYREGATVWVKKLYVLPQAQGRGAGRALMQTVIEAFSPAQVVRLYVNNRNVSAQVFYERCGFVREKEVPVQMGDFRFTDYVYVRSIPLASR